MGSSDDRYTESYSSVPDGHDGAYVIPPIEEEQRRRKRRGSPVAGIAGADRTRPVSSAPRRSGVGPAMRPAAPSPNSASGGAARPAAGGWTIDLRQTSFRFVVSACVIFLMALVAIVSGVLSMFDSGDGDGDGAVVVSEPAATAAPVMAEPPATFSDIDAAGLSALYDDPAAHIGEGFRAYATVSTADMPESDVPDGYTAHFVSISVDQPSDRYEFASDHFAIVIAPQRVAVADDELLRVQLYVPDPSTFSSYYAQSGYPRFNLATSEPAGYDDLTQDVTLGEIRWDGPDPVLPVSVHNGASVPLSYGIDITAVSPDGTDAASVTAWSDTIPAGETGSADVTIYGTIPDGVTFRIDSVDRY